MPQNEPARTPGERSVVTGFGPPARIIAMGVNRGAMSDARAKLYAAAPDLLEAAKRALAAFTALGSPECEAAKRCRAAIARATGD